ncbi:hypothetical protein PFDG_00189 [Plasmodium falciparum Dd2]|uniref:Rifin n=1 Tax=Plasmodium falciparum (isolate Dd2) TaxID=57267 RepID=A0A0L7LWH4_PLAF4|nr:hypothetical protein PFDG_00189 [Plasmodium falciparum Dd2]
MKVHYINILLFALPLNILVNNQRNYNNSTYHTSNTKTIKSHRSLCECELYAQSNYDDQEMTDVIKEFNNRTAQRFEEYNERMQEKRKQCKEQYGKDIQKIILKDKIEKELTEKFSTLETNIDISDIPTCVCEKSVADKTEKVCLNCGKTMGAVAPAWGLISGLGYAAWAHYVAGVAAKAATDAGVKAAIKGLGNVFNLIELPGVNIPGMVNAGNFKNTMHLIQGIMGAQNKLCTPQIEDTNFFCSIHSNKGGPWFAKAISTHAQNISTDASQAAEAAELAEAAKFVPKTTILSNTIIASIVAIVVIVLVMVIIYLILRYRRKKKMKKKFQYIKLLKE